MTPKANHQVTFDSLRPAISRMMPAAHPGQFIVDAIQEDISSRDGENMWLYAAMSAAELIEAIQAYAPSREHEATAKALQKPIAEVTPQDITMVFAHFAMISDVATLAENKQTSAAKFLIQFHDIDPDTPLIAAALAQLASPTARKAVEKYARAWQKSQI